MGRGDVEVGGDVFQGEEVEDFGIVVDEICVALKRGLADVVEITLVDGVEEHFG